MDYLLVPPKSVNSLRSKKIHVFPKCYGFISGTRSWCTHNFRFEFKNLLSITIRIMAQKNLFLFNQVDGRTSLFYNCVHVSNEFL